MSKERLSKLLTELDAELNETGNVDDDTRKLLERLNDDIDRLTGETYSTTIDRANRLESRFAADHPVAARIVREFADLLAKMGI